MANRDFSNKTDYKTTPTDKPTDTARDQAIRSACLDMAIRSGSGQYWDDNNHLLFDDDLIFKAASKFEAFIKNGSTPEVTPIATKKEW